VTRRLAALSLFLTASLAAATTIPIAPRDVITDTNMGRGRPFLTAATNGSTFIVVWEDRLFPAWDSTASIFARTYKANGLSEQPLPVLIAGNGIGPSAVWSGTDWIVSWRTYIDRFDTRPIARLYAARLNEHATESSTPVELAETQSGTGGGSGAATDGSNLFIGNLGNTVVTSDDLQVRVKLDHPLRPLAAADGTFLGQGPGSTAIVSRDGAILQNIATSNITAAAADAHEYAIVYATNDSLEALTAGTDGTIRSRTTLQTNVKAASPAVVHRGDSYLATWTTGQHDICFATFTGATKSAAQCQEAGGLLESLALVDNGTLTLVAWSIYTGGWPASDRVLTSFSPSSAMPQLQPADAATMLRAQSAPRLELDPKGITAVWTDGFSPYLGGLNHGAAQTRAASVVSIESQALDNLRVSRSRNKTLTLWSRKTATATPSLVAEITPDDGSPSSLVTIGSGTIAEVASDGDGWLVVWVTDDPTPQLLSTIITSNGTVVSPGGIALATSQWGQRFPRVASRGTDYLVSWFEDGSTRRLMALGVSPGGTPNGAVLDLAGGPMADLQMAVNGRFYLLVVQAPNIGLPVTSTIPDILVAGVPDSPLRVRPRDGGFAILHGSPLHASYIDALGHESDGGVLPLTAYDFDFIYDGPRLVLAHTVYEGWSPKLLLEVFEPRMRASAR
jgi:hypothetical protein